jgi:hypothetical protein
MVGSRLNNPNLHQRALLQGSGSTAGLMEIPLRTRRVAAPFEAIPIKWCDVLIQFECKCQPHRIRRDVDTTNIVT